MDARQHEGSTTEYVLGHTGHEIERLIAQGQLYEPLTTQLFRDAGITAGMRVLDVGSGGGDVSLLVARMVGPTGQVIGVERAEAAVAIATQRAADLHLRNVRFLAGDAGEVTFDEPFDAVVGRFVLQHCPEPAAVLRALARQVKPGGVIVFQEVDWSGCRSMPESATFSGCVRWGMAALERSGADPRMGLKLSAAFSAAGLPTPNLFLHAGIGAGQAHPVYTSVSNIMRTLLPTMENLGVATASELDVETLASRLSDEMVATHGTLVWVSLVGAAVRKGTE